MNVNVVPLTVKSVPGTCAIPLSVTIILCADETLLTNVTGVVVPLPTPACESTLSVAVSLVTVNSLPR